MSTNVEEVLIEILDDTTVGEVEEFNTGDVDLEVSIGSTMTEATAQQTEVLEVEAYSGPQGRSGRSPMVFGMTGTVAPKIGSLGFWPRVNGIITRVTASVTTQISGVTRVDVNIGTPPGNPVSIFTNQAHRPNLAATGRHFDDADSIDNGVFTENDFITCDVDSAGVGVTDLIVHVDYEETA